MASAAEKLHYSGGSTRGDLAYDLDWAVREHALRHAGEAVRPKEEVQPQVRHLEGVRVRQRQKLSRISVTGIALAAVLAVLMLVSHIQLTALSNDTVQLKDELSVLQAEHVSLTAQYERVYDLETVKQAAMAAGMTKPSNSQIFYIDLSEGDSAVVYEPEEPDVISRMVDSVQRGIHAAMEYFG